MTPQETKESASGNVLALVPDDAERPVRDAADAAGVEAELCSGLDEAFRRIQEGTWAALLVSFSVPEVDETVIERLAGAAGAATLLLCSPGASLEQAMVMERSGAAALLREPLDPDELSGSLGEAVAAPDEVVELPEPQTSDAGEPVLVGSGPEMARIFETVARVADSEATVLITGESGTGKELAARALHWASGRRDEPFVPVNCAALPEHLLESELFGHERGAFTGAVARKKGRFERAEGGTLFLDEIGDMSLPLQAKILRALEDGVIERVGGEEQIALDVRVVAATNRSLDRHIEEGEFREDLYYRLAVVELEMPPLRERSGDLRELALHFAAHFARRHDRELKGVSEEALRRLEAYPWPGNVRELRNVLDRAVLLASDGILRARDLRLGSAAPRLSARDRRPAGGYEPTRSLEEVEADHIQQVLRYTGGHMGDASEILGIHRNTLTRKVREYELEAPEEAPEG